MPWRPWKKRGAHQYASGCGMLPAALRQGIGRDTVGYWLVPTTPAPAPGGWPGLGTGPQRCVGGSISVGSQPQLPSKLPLDQHSHPISPTGMMLAPTGDVQLHEDLPCSLFFKSSLLRGLGTSDTTEQHPRAGPCEQGQLQPHPTSQPRSWLSAGTARGHSPSGCALPG